MAITWGVSSAIFRDSTANHQARVDALVGMHASIARCELGWDRVETSSGTKDWSKPDSAITKLEAAGIEVMVQIDGTPQWQSGSADRFVIPGGGNGAADASFTAWVAAYQTWVTTVVNRYKPGGTAGTNVVKWELWNEPNLAAIYWKPTADVAQFSAWYDALRTSIRAAHASARVCSGGMTAWNTAASGTPAKSYAPTFLNGSRTIDVFGWHAYTDNNFSNDPEIHTPGVNNWDDLGLVRAQLNTSGYSAVPIWITETGFNSATLGTTLQGQYVAKVFELARGYPSLEIVCHFSDVDDTVFMGLMDANLNLKPAGVAFRDGVRRYLSGPRRKSRVRTHR